MKDKRVRRKFSIEEKVAILRRHMVDQVPVSTLCEEYRIQPSLFYVWQRQMWENLGAAFQNGSRPGQVSLRETGLEKQIEVLKETLAQREARLAKKDKVIAELSAEFIEAKKSRWGALTGRWVAPDVRDQVVDCVASMAEKTELPVSWFVRRLQVQPGKFYDWRLRYGRVNEHNQAVPRDHWIEPWEREVILRYRAEYPLEGYRRLSFMMLDADVVAVSPSTVYRILSAAGVLDRYSRRVSKKGTGFHQPTHPHEHWHIDVSYINLGGTFYYLCSILDGYSRIVVHWELHESMKEPEVELVIQRAREKYPHARPRIISDNGPQFIARDFKLFIRELGMTHVRTSPYYPQSNGKLERWHQTLKVETIRPACPATKEEAERLIERFVQHYNQVRLHSAIGYITPADKLAGREDEIWAERDRRLEAAREARRKKRLCA